MMFKRRAGFTLVELLVTLAIVGIAASLAVPNVMTSIMEYRASAAGRQLMTDLQFAKTSAVSQVVHYRVTFNVGQKQYIVSRFNSATGNWDQVGVTRALAVPGTPYYVAGGAFAINLTGGQTFVEFTALGTATTTGGITITVNGRQRTVNVNSIGRVNVS
jgi:prepilin-type N-terminal cleavage/methylation domain-containing protein